MMIEVAFLCPKNIAENFTTTKHNCNILKVYHGCLKMSCYSEDVTL